MIPNGIVVEEESIYSSLLQNFSSTHERKDFEITRLIFSYYTTESLKTALWGNSYKRFCI